MTKESESKIPVDVGLEQMKIVGLGKDGGWRREESLEVIGRNILAYSLVIFLSNVKAKEY